MNYELVRNQSGLTGTEFARKLWGDKLCVVCRDGFREHGALGHLSFWGPKM